LKKDIICTVCPVGCNITVEGSDDEVTVIEGYSCKRGKEYGSQEFLHPVRILTTTVKIEGAAEELLPVRSEQPLPKELIMDCMKVISHTVVKTPVRRYDAVIPNICNSGVDIVATGSFE